MTHHDFVDVPNAPKIRCRRCGLEIMGIEHCCEGYWLYDASLPCIPDTPCTESKSRDSNEPPVTP